MGGGGGREQRGKQAEPRKWQGARVTAHGGAPRVSSPDGLLSQPQVRRSLTFIPSGIRFGDVLTVAGLAGP